MIGPAIPDRKALDADKEASSLYEFLNEHGKEADALNASGSVCLYLGEYKEALDYLNRALTLRRTVSSERPAGEADILNNIGSTYAFLGQYQKSLGFYSQALAFYRTSGDGHGEAAILNSMSGIYDSLGDEQGALDYLKRALPLASATSDRSLKARTQINMGRSIFHWVTSKRLSNV